MTPRRALRAALIAFALAANPVRMLAAPPPGALSGKPPPRSTAPVPGGSASLSPAGDDGGAVAADRAAGLSTPIWREPSPPLDLAWHLLALPEYVVDLAFSPLGF